MKIESIMVFDTPVPSEDHEGYYHNEADARDAAARTVPNGLQFPHLHRAENETGPGDVYFVCTCDEGLLEIETRDSENGDALAWRADVRGLEVHEYTFVLEQVVETLLLAYPHLTVRLNKAFDRGRGPDVEEDILGWRWIHLPSDLVR